MNDLGDAVLFACGPAPLKLASEEVHVWCARVDRDACGAREMLSREERLRAERFHFEADRRRFVIARTLRRVLVSRYLGCDPDAVTFAQGLQGKPAVAAPHSDLRFNVSHSGALVLFAVSLGREIGVDVELMREDIPFEMLAEHYFAPAEAWQIARLDGLEKARRFYEVWTTTEARLKAIGAGLAQGMHVATAQKWAVRTLTPAPGYAAALAVEGGKFELTCWSWPN
jgi:4'-phosphopantetheinyl transferase